MTTDKQIQDSTDAPVAKKARKERSDKGVKRGPRKAKETL